MSSLLGGEYGRDVEHGTTRINGFASDTYNGEVSRPRSHVQGSTMDTVQHLLWSTTLRKVITMSVCWGSLLILVTVLVYSAGRSGDSGGSGGGGGGGGGGGTVNGGVPAQTYVGDFKYYPGSPDLSPVAMPVNLTIGYMADTALTEDTQALYLMMKKEGVELIVISGDLDYINNPEGWDRLITNTLGDSFPMLVAAGNHDYAIWPRYQKLIIDRWQRANIQYCIGVVGFAHTCTYKGLTIVQVTPGVFNESKGIFKDVDGIGNYDMVDYIHRSFGTYSGNRWKVCAWHKNQHMMQTGEKKDETGWGVYNECLKQGAMIMTGHEHSYERTYLMSDLEHQTIAPGNEKRNMAISSTKGFVVVQGMGGRGIRPNLNPAEHWAVLDNTNTSATFSGTVCKYNYNGNGNKAYCYSKDLRNRIIDSWYITLTSQA